MMAMLLKLTNGTLRSHFLPSSSSVDDDNNANPNDYTDNNFDAEVSVAAAVDDADKADDDADQAADTSIAKILTECKDQPSIAQWTKICAKMDQGLHSNQSGIALQIDRILLNAKIKWYCAAIDQVHSN